jgi:hypothetical protein
MCFYISFIGVSVSPLVYFLYNSVLLKQALVVIINDFGNSIRRTAEVRFQFRNIVNLTFQVLTATSIKMAFRVAVPYSLVEVYRRFRGSFCLHHQGIYKSRNVFEDGVVLLRSILWTLYIVLMFCNHNISRDGSSLVIRWTYSVGSDRSS